MAKLRSLPPRLGAAAPKLRAAPKRAEPFYQSREWRALVAQIKRERGNWCERCGSGGRIVGDHRRELKDGGAPLDPANVELLCLKRCHPRKTAEARRLRALGRAP
ncbi:MAG TPA: HNH endonuclease signature motif containing protein [Allosphingosinicella sp.]|nr:HNH endonuclease signature motif containing protein [Allosphingosinicella sp.]